MRRRDLLLMFPLATLAACIKAAPEGQAASSRSSTKGRLSLGLTGLNRNESIALLDWYPGRNLGQARLTKRDRTVITGRDIWDAGYYDPVTSDLKRPVPPDVAEISYYFYQVGITPSDYDARGLRWHIAWDGKGACRIDALLDTGPGNSSNIDSHAGHGTFTFGDRGGTVHTSVTFTITDPQDPPRNIRIWLDRYDANFRRGERFNPDWLEQIRGFHTLRIMDWMHTNGSAIVEFSDIADLDYRAWGGVKSPDKGSKGGMPLAIIAELANTTGCNIHFCIPHQASDDCVRKIATFFRDHTNVELIYEYSNECWNGGFKQASYCREQSLPIWGASDGRAYFKWYGYRAAQCMTIVRAVYRDATRWRGALATQTVNPSATQAALEGVKRFLAQDPAAKNLTMNNLFKSLMVTGYFGDVQQGTEVAQVTRSNPAVVTTTYSHGFANGQKIKWFVFSGMTQLDNVTATVANVTDKTFELAGVDSSQWPAWIDGNRNYVIDATLFTMMDESIARHARDPATYPERSTWFAEQLRDSLITGSCAAGFKTRVNVASLKQQFWPAQRAVAVANGLDLRQYEGGCHFVGNGYLTGYGGNPQFTEFLLATGHSEQMAEAYSASYKAFSEAGGSYPNKFTELSGSSPYGTWGGIRYLPGDENNPVWRAVRAANEA